jgi:hypothetical protein
MDIGDELVLQCGDPFFRGFEQFFRRELYKYRHMPADMILRPYIPVCKVIHSTGIGISVDENIVKSGKKTGIVSHEYHDMLPDEAALEKLQIPKITYDQAATMANYNKIGEAIGDILPVKTTGLDCLYIATWDDIARYRGVTNLLMDLVDRPEFSHAVISRFTEIKVAQMEQYEALGLFENDPPHVHETATLTDDLPGKDFSGDKLTRKNIWGRGTAQIFGSVGAEMHKEFDIDYMQKTVGQCGLTYYGCCEPLDKKVDILEEIPNLRKISITPWADINTAAESIGKRYAIASKPNPAAVAVPVLDKDVLKKEIRTILDACKRYGCSFDMVLKDISTCANRPQNIFEWEQIVMDMVQNY